MFARFINIIIATWILVAAFAFRPPTAQFVSMLCVGVLVLGFEALAFFSNRMRFFDTALGAWLMVSGFALPTQGDFILWNNFFCGVAIVVLSMVRTKVKYGGWMSHPNEEANVRR